MRLQTHTIPSLSGTCRKRCKSAHKPNLRQEPSSPFHPNTRTEWWSKHENIDRMNKGQSVTRHIKHLAESVDFNYLFSNGDAHLKNFSLIETSMGDFKLSPAYDLLNSGIHIEDRDFALDDGLLPKNLAQGKVNSQFRILSEKAGINEKVYNELLNTMVNHTGLVEKLTFSSFLDEKTQRNYFQSYQTRLRKLNKN